MYHRLERLRTALPLLIGMILVIVLRDYIIPGVAPKWAIFALVIVLLSIWFVLGIPLGPGYPVSA